MKIAAGAALFAIPLLVVAGAAFDCARAASRRAELQQVTETATRLVADSSINALSTPAMLLPIARTRLAELDKDAVVTDVALSHSDRSLCLKTSRAISTSAMALANVTTLPVAASACAQTME